LRARTALFSAINLGNYSEFGLIVAALAASYGWIGTDWLINIALAVSLSFVVSAVLNRQSHEIYDGFRDSLIRYQHPVRLHYDEAIDVGGARILIVGMGRLGAGAYARMNEAFPGQVLGVDTDLEKVRVHRGEDWNIIRGDPSDSDFWERVEASHSVELVMLALPRATTSIAVMEQLRRTAYNGAVAAVARYPDEVRALEKAGADTVVNIYSEAGGGFASEAVKRLRLEPDAV